MNGAFPSSKPFFSFTEPFFPSSLLGERLLFFALFSSFLLAKPFHAFFHFSLSLLLLLQFLTFQFAHGNTRRTLAIVDRFLL